MSKAISQAAAIMGRVKSVKKAKAVRINGRLGGRPKKQITDLQRKRALGGSVKGNAAQRRKAKREAKRINL
jgi:hypothetical protein